MGYSNQMTAAQWIQGIVFSANNVVSDLQYGSILNDKFVALTYGLTDPQILALPQFAAANWSETDLTNVKFALSSMAELNTALNNGAISTANRFGYLEPFLLG